MIGKGHINGGRFFVRKALYMTALVAARHNEKMTTFYRRLLAAGKPAKVALVAVMRKIIVCLIVRFVDIVSNYYNALFSNEIYIHFYNLNYQIQQL